MVRMGSLANSKKVFKKKGHAALFEALRNLQPDVIVLGRANINSTTLEAMRNICPDAKFIAWSTDSHDTLLQKMHWLSMISHYVDILYVTSAGRALGDIGKRVAHLKKVAFFPNITDTKIDYHRAFRESSYQYDVLYLGTPHSVSEPQKRDTFIDEVIGKTRQLRWLKAGPGSLQGVQYYDALKVTKFGINISQFIPNNYPWYTPDSIAHLTGNGLLTFNQNFPGLEQLFTEHETVAFERPGQLVELLNFYHEHPKLAQRIAKAGRRKAHKSYGAKRITRYMLEAITGHFSENYEWQNQVVLADTS